MALADLVQDVVTDMNGPICHHPKYVGTSRKVHAGTVKAAGTLLLKEKQTLLSPVTSVRCN